MWLGQKSRRDRDWESHNPPNRGCRGLGWVQSFEERRLRVTKSHFWVTLIPAPWREGGHQDPAPLP